MHALRRIVLTTSLVAIVSSLVLMRGCGGGMAHIKAGASAWNAIVSAATN